MTTKTPTVADVVLYFPAVADQHGGARPLPAIVQQVLTSGDDQTVTLTVFGGGGGTFLAQRVIHRDRHAERPDPTAVACWAWPDDKGQV